MIQIDVRERTAMFCSRIGVLEDGVEIYEIEVSDLVFRDEIEETLGDEYEVLAKKRTRQSMLQDGLPI